LVTLRSYQGRIAFEDYIHAVREFHGFPAPGVVLGGFMVDWAMEAMEGHELLDALVETRKCLPDAVQILTLCSIGNGWLRVLDWGKLAVTLYDKVTLEGARVHLDLEKARRFPLLGAWAMKEKAKDENPLEPLLDEIVRAGRDPLTCREIRLNGVPEGRMPYGDPKICPRCGEAYRYGPGGICEGCAQPFLGRR
jgi:formylmethanofuran dehydrogenase subunit E